MNIKPTASSSTFEYHSQTAEYREDPTALQTIQNERRFFLIEEQKRITATQLSMCVSPNPQACNAAKTLTAFLIMEHGDRLIIAIATPTPP